MEEDSSIDFQILIGKSYPHLHVSDGSQKSAAFGDFNGFQAVSKRIMDHTIPEDFWRVALFHSLVVGCE